VEGLNEIKVVKLPTPGDLFLLFFFIGGNGTQTAKSKPCSCRHETKALFKTYFQKARFHDI
jgi:hypothetical protein